MIAGNTQTTDTSLERHRYIYPFERCVSTTSTSLLVASPLYLPVLYLRRNYFDPFVGCFTAMQEFV
jgi:hypothetical protein